MADRGFEMVSASDPTDKYHRVRIRCSHTGCDRTLIFARRGVIEPVHAAKWFRDKQWFVGGHERSDLCPDHYKKHARHKADGGANIKTKHENIVLTPEMASQITAAMDTLQEPVVPEAPVTLSRTDKRIIHNKLDEVYVDETVGYRQDWSDERVATDLGVATEWVAIVREDSFGPNISKEAQREKVERLAGQLSLQLDAYRMVREETDRMIAAYEEAVKEWKA